MKIGIRLHDTLPGTLGERLDFARAQGFSCAHLALSKAVPGFQMSDAPERLEEAFATQVRREFEGRSMECAVLGCYLSLADADGERLGRTQAIYRAHLRFSRLMGARVVGTETPAAKEMKLSRQACATEEAFQLFLKGLAPVVRWAEEEGAILAIEPVYQHIVSTPEKAERVLDAIPSEHLRVILDAVNLIAPESAEDAPKIIEEAIRRLGEKVSVLHMKDFRVSPDHTVLTSLACGTGQMRYDSLLRFAQSRDLPMTLENTTPENAEDARKYLEKIASAL